MKDNLKPMEKKSLSSIGHTPTEVTLIPVVGG
jgi:hypothetical protein